MCLGSIRELSRAWGASVGIHVYCVIWFLVLLRSTVVAPPVFAAGYLRGGSNAKCGSFKSVCCVKSGNLMVIFRGRSILRYQLFASSSEICIAYFRAILSTSVRTGGLVFLSWQLRRVLTVPTKHCIGSGFSRA